MKKLFNKKIMKLYIVLLCVTLVGGMVCAGFSISFNSQIKKIEEENKPSVTDALADTLADLLASAVTESDTTSTEEKVDPEIEKLQEKKTVSLVVMAVFFVFSALSGAAITTSYQYEKYLQSDKYKAKLKRLKKYEKTKQAKA